MEIEKEINEIENNEYIDRHDLNRKEALEEEFNKIAKKLTE